MCFVFVKESEESETERENFQENHKPQKLSFGSPHLVATHFQECQSEGGKKRKETQRGVSVIVTRQTDKTDEV